MYVAEKTPCQFGGVFLRENGSILPSWDHRRQVKEFKMWTTAFFDSNHGHPPQSPFKGGLKKSPFEGRQVCARPENKPEGCLQRTASYPQSQFLNLTRMLLGWEFQALKQSICNY
ncbi:MAG: hypothetical protein DWQ05_01960 [Calditrichaeota bacterium]|nr:MAG: hypothetical protein DWQ05_01960 [Calditrichota bacterium]